MDCPLHWRHVSTCYRVICACCAYVTIRRTLGDTRCTPRHFVNKVSVRQFSAENKQESAEFYSQHLPMHSRDVIWKIKPKSTFPVSFSLVSAEMNLVGYYRTLRGLRTVNHEGLPSTNLFADADTGIYPHAASQYHARPKAKRGIAMLSVDKFPYPRKQTRGNEFIPCSNNICNILKRFRSFKIPAITLIWSKSSYKHSVTRSYRSDKESGRRSESPLWRHQWRSFVFISHADDVKREIRLHISRLLTNQKRESARSMG